MLISTGGPVILGGSASSSGGGGSNGPLVASIALSGAQIATWNSVPIQLLPAPGAGKFIDVLAVTLSSFQGTSSYFTNLSGTKDIHINGSTLLYNNDYATGTSSTLFGTTQAYPTPDTSNNIQKLQVPVLIVSTDVNEIYSSFAANNQPLLLIGGSDADGTGGVGANALGSGGLLYAAGDAFTLNDGSGSAFGYVDTVDGVTGAVLTYHLVSIGGSFSLPDTSATTALTGSIKTATVTSGNAGLNYAVGDLFEVTTGDTTAWCEVDSVDGSGAVLTFHVVWGGSTYTVGTGNSTAVLSGFGNSGLQVDIGTVQDSDGSGLTIVITSVILPNSTMKVDLVYTIRSL